MHEEWETFKSLLDNGHTIYWMDYSYKLIKKPDDYYLKCTLNNHLSAFTIDGVLQYSVDDLFCE